MVRAHRCRVLKPCGLEIGQTKRELVLRCIKYHLWAGVNRAWGKIIAF